MKKGKKIELTTSKGMELCHKSIQNYMDKIIIDMAISWVLGHDRWEKKMQKKRDFNDKLLLKGKKSK